MPHEEKSTAITATRPRLLLPNGQVDIWLCPIDTVSVEAESRCRDLLYADERQRWERFKSPDAQLQFAVGRALIRTALSTYTDVPPRHWRFSTNRFGRPEIAEPAQCRHLHFSLSHTSRLVALAVSETLEIGLDLEWIDREVDIQAVAAVAFAAREADLIAGLPPEVARDLFFELWTLKEAYIKARGLGLSLPPSSFWLEQLAGQIALRCSADCDPDPGRWQFAGARLPADHRIALAIGSRVRHATRWLECRSLEQQVFDIVEPPVDRPFFQ